LSKKRIQNSVKNERILRDINKLFFDGSNRPKKTPLHLSVIQRKLEDEYSPWQVSEGLKKLKRSEILSSLTTQTDSIRKIVFYYPGIFDNDIKKKELILEKITKSCYWIERYSNQKITSVIGKHLHALVKSELRAQGFNIIKEGRVRSYNGKIWKESRHSLDMIVEHASTNITMGVEIKNTLDIISKKEIKRKISMCEYFGIIPLFACRWLKPHAEQIKSNNAFAWQFEFQIYPLGMEELVNKVQKKFNYKMKVSSELPQKAIAEFKEYMRTLH